MIYLLITDLVSIPSIIQKSRQRYKCHAEQKRGERVTLENSTLDAHTISSQNSVRMGEGKVSFPSFIDVLRQVIIIGETLKVSKQRKIQEWGTLSKAFL